jgi:hypothetical protein
MLNGADALFSRDYWIMWFIALALGFFMVSLPKAGALPGLIVVLTAIMAASVAVSGYDAVLPDGVVFEFRILHLANDSLTVEILPDGPVLDLQQQHLRFDVDTLTTPPWFFLVGASEFIRLPWSTDEQDRLGEHIRSSVPVLFERDTRVIRVERPVLFAEYRVVLRPGFAVTTERL